GILTILLGLLSLYGGFESGRSLTYIVGSMSLPREALKKEPGYHQQSLSWFILCGIAGGMAILLSLLGAALLG
ncbi:MAG: hypothetical protein HY866_13085, partial [Chloroflexi bacterium]|nr:hypothetical protein [Chloroflexota bacterium]